MNKKKLIKIGVVLVVIFIPIMYSFFYLKSYWDPYGKLENMVIALVNEDEGEDGKNLGQEFVDKLVDKNVIGIKQVDSEEAQKGLVENDYFAVITIPSSFTKHLNSAASTDKQIATITYSPNQKFNYLGAQIIGKIVTVIEAELQSQVSEQVVDTLATNIKEIPGSLGEINDGVDQLLDGSNKLQDGLGTINTGVGTLQTNYNQFDSGVDSAFNGSQTLTNGIGQVNSGVSSLNSGATQLDSAISQINDGANTLSTQAGAGVEKLTTGVKQLDEGAAQLAGGTTALVAGTSAESQLGSGAAQVANGASAIANATASNSALGSGAVQVANGASAIAQATSGTSALGAGANGLNTGISNYVATVNNLLPALVGAGVIDEGTKSTLEQSGASLISGAGAVSTGIATLNTNAQNLATGAGAVSTGIATLNTNAQNLAAGAGAVSGGISTLNASAQQLNEGAGKLKAGISALAGQETVQSLNKLVDGTKTLQGALGKVKTGTETLKNGVGTLGDGTNKLQSGSQTLTNGLGTLSSSSKQVKDALSKLKTGTQSAYDGSKDLTDGIQTLKDGVSDGIDKANEQIVKLDGLGEFVKDPVEIKEVDYGEVSSYGIAFTPLFICVGLWVGILMAYVNLYYDQQNRFNIFGKHSERKIIRSLAYCGIAVIQGFITAFLLKIGLNLSIENNLLYYGSTVIIAVMFMTIVQFLIVNFGEAGKLIGLFLLILQLASSGGTFPVEIIDEGFQKLTPYMPMTYTIRVLKESLIKQDTGMVGKNMKVIVAYTIVAFTLTVIGDLIREKKRKRKEENDTVVNE